MDAPKKQYEAPLSEGGQRRPNPTHKQKSADGVYMMQQKKNTASGTRITEVSSESNHSGLE